MISFKKLLTAFLSAAMVLTSMAIPAFADDENGTGESDAAVQITHADGETATYNTLQEAFDSAKKDDTITLLKNITLENGVNVYNQDVLNGITLDGNQKTISFDLTNADNKTALRFGDPDYNPDNSTAKGV